MGILNLFSDFALNQNQMRYGAFNQVLTETTVSPSVLTQDKNWKHIQNPHDSSLLVILILYQLTQEWVATQPKRIQNSLILNLQMVALVFTSINPRSKRCTSFNTLLQNLYNAIKSKHDDFELVFIVNNLLTVHERHFPFKFPWVLAPFGEKEYQWVWSKRKWNCFQSKKISVRKFFAQLKFL